MCLNKEKEREKPVGLHTIYDGLHPFQPVVNSLLGMSTDTGQQVQMVFRVTKEGSDCTADQSLSD